MCNCTPWLWSGWNGRLVPKYTSHRLTTRCSGGWLANRTCKSRADHTHVSCWRFGTDGFILNLGMSSPFRRNMRAASYALFLIMHSWSRPLLHGLVMWSRVPYHFRRGYSCRCDLVTVTCVVTLGSQEGWGRPAYLNSVSDSPSVLFMVFDVRLITTASYGAFVYMLHILNG